MSSDSGLSASAMPNITEFLKITSNCLQLGCFWNPTAAHTAVAGSTNVSHQLDCLTYRGKNKKEVYFGPILALSIRFLGLEMKALGLTLPDSELRPRACTHPYSIESLGWTWCIFRAYPPGCAETLPVPFTLFRALSQCSISARGTI